MCSYDHHFSLGAKSGHICHSGGIREVAWSLIPFIIKDEKWQMVLVEKNLFTNAGVAVKIMRVEQLSPFNTVETSQPAAIAYSSLYRRPSM
jgi:hypothetical protein